MPLQNVYLITCFFSHDYDQVAGNVERIFMEETRKKTLASSCYEIHLRPTVILHNSLPIPIFITTYGTTSEVRVMPGESRILSTVEPGACFVIMKVFAAVVGRVLILFAKNLCICN